MRSLARVAITPAKGTPVGTFTVYSTSSLNNCPVKPFTLAQNLTCTIQVGFTPPDSIPFNATLQVVDTNNNKYLLTLTGEGLD